MDGIDPTHYTESPFTDVKISTWYGPAVSWAMHSGIIDEGILSSGTLGKFQPLDNVTREEMAVIFANYLRFRGFALNSTTVPEFNDIYHASDWAEEAINAMRRYSIIQGVGGNRYNPRGEATRAEVSQIFTNLVGAIVGATN